MAFAEALSDDGSLTGRGTPWIRGSITGLMTAIGGLGHTLPYLIPDFRTATVLAFVVVVLELAAISWIRHRYMDTPLFTAAFQVMFGGALGLRGRDTHRQLLMFTLAHLSESISRRCRTPSVASSFPSAGSDTSTGCANAVRSIAPTCWPRWWPI